MEPAVRLRIRLAKRLTSLAPVYEGYDIFGQMPRKFDTPCFTLKPVDEQVPPGSSGVMRDRNWELQYIRQVDSTDISKSLDELETVLSKIIANLSIGKNALSVSDPWLDETPQINSIVWGGATWVYPTDGSKFIGFVIEFTTQFLTS